MPSILNKQIGETGFGMMGLTWRPQVTPDDQAFATMKVRSLLILLLCTSNKSPESTRAGRQFLELF
jgi:hypothetical protein